MSIEMLREKEERWISTLLDQSSSLEKKMCLILVYHVTLSVEFLDLLTHCDIGLEFGIVEP